MAEPREHPVGEETDLVSESGPMTQAGPFRAAVASPHHLASEAGLAVLREGGNAVDAAIAVNLTLGVVTPYLCGYGGDLFAMVWDGTELFACDGAGGAPAGATVEAMRAATGADVLPARGPLTVTVPGAVEGWFALLERFGTKSFAELSHQALQYARDGFQLSARGAASIANAKRAYKDEREWNSIYGAAEASRPLRQTDLARTLERLAEDGPEVYYRGEIAHAIADHLKERGALMTAGDLAVHQGLWVAPMSVAYRDIDIFEMPPPTQGVAALEALAIADGLPESPPETAERHHLLIEATKLALSDMNARVTDPRFMAAPAEEMLAKDFIEDRRARIDSEHAGDPPRWRPLGGGTAYMCAADASGMCVSLIQSNYAGFGSGVTVPGWGINLHSRGTWFSLDAAHPNAIAPGKRTMHTLIPAMAFRDDRPLLVSGTMGGEGQAQTHVQMVTRMIDDGLEPQAAIDSPRWFTSPADWKVFVESRFDEAVIEGLRARGHDVTVTTPFDERMGHAHAILVTPEGYVPGTDPRAEGAALGF